jgi:hypothetical protein
LTKQNQKIKIESETTHNKHLSRKATFISTILFLTGFQLLSGNFHGNGEPPQ